MTFSALFFLLCISASWAKTTSSTSTSSAASSNAFYSTSISTLSSVIPSSLVGSKYTYPSSKGQITLTSTASSSAAANASSSQSTVSKKKTASLVTLGGKTSSATNGTATSSAAKATNTVPCNGYPEFCSRQYSNITQVCAHNSAFAIKNNAGSNQIYGVTDQLDDGVRMIQGETHYVNDTVFSCHTTCDLLNAGPWLSELETVVAWLKKNPYDVVTWLIVNSDFVKVENYLPAIRASGIEEYLYTPAYVPQHRDQWPTLSDMILTNKRVVMFMDYNANQTAVPYILDEFTHMWETPFSPTNRSFPCTEQRPPGLNETVAREKFMYLANHNLNVGVDLSALLGSSGAGGEVILIPNTADINITNGQFNQYGQLEAMTRNCTADWGVPPNFLLVDYYNYGDPRPGSVFEVAARANGVTYNGKCCGGSTSAASTVRWAVGTLVAALALASGFVW